MIPSSSPTRRLPDPTIILKQSLETGDCVSPRPLKNRVVFLDRDGVINRDSPDYIKSRAEFEFLPGSLEAIRQLSEAGYRPIVVSNQSAVNRGLISINELEAIHRMLAEAVRRAGGRIDDILYCPHRPDENCPCRKPKTGLIRRAAAKHAIDPVLAVFVGDSAKDIECARNAGCRIAVLVRTGNGAEAELLLKAKGIRVDHVAENLLEAVHWMLRTFTKPDVGPSH
jgi:D-glycero-D-manno-heptose 1,7-bisphosphate phosphatase